MTEDSDDTDRTTGFPVKLEASAKASFEVSTEIPSEVTGKAVHRVLDLFSPFTEGMGLIGDHIRYQRFDVLQKLAHKVREILPEEVEVLPVEPKVFVPFLELASLENADNDYMIEAWAKLLISASTNPKPELRRFISVLSEIDPVHARLFDFIMMKDAATHHPYEEWLEVKDIPDTLVTSHILALQAEFDHEDCKERIARFSKRRGMIALDTRIIDDDKLETIMEVWGDLPPSLMSQCDVETGMVVLDSLNLLRWREVSDMSEDEKICVMTKVASVTDFGISFFLSCLDNTIS